MKKTVLHFSDEELIDTLKKEKVENSAISFLYRSFYALLNNYIKQNQGSEQDAEDIFQEVILNFIEIVKKDKFRGESSIKTFLFTLNKYTWLNELKKRGRTALREERYSSETEANEKDVSCFLADRDARKLVLALMDKLGELCRKILTAYYYDNLAIREILPLVNYENEQVLRNKKYKCLKSLEQLLAVDQALAQRLKSALTYEQ
jgi:RNA polymerase sigma factor (sigma-70 family)